MRGERSPDSRKGAGRTFHASLPAADVRVTLDINVESREVMVSTIWG